MASWRLLVVLVLLSGCSTQTQRGPVTSVPPAAEFAPFPDATPSGATRVYASIGPPGDPEGIVLVDDQVHVTVSSSNYSTVPELWTFELSDPRSSSRLSISGPPGEPVGRVQGIAADAAGRLYATDSRGGRILRIDVRVQPPIVETFATLPDLAPCSAGTIGPCEHRTKNNEPGPNNLVFDQTGNLYVSDMGQGLIVRVSPQGAPSIWFNDPRIAAYTGTAPNGLAIDAAGSHLYFLQTFLTSASFESGGAVFRIPIANPSPERLELVHRFPGALTDGLAFGQSGNLYVTHGDIVDGLRHGISVLSPTGDELAFYPAPAENEKRSVPYHFPANIAFHDAHRSVLVTNQAFGEEKHWAVLETFVDDVGAPLRRPDI